MIGLNKEPRLRFTDEERADPALEKPIRKTEKATARADKAQANIPKKKVRQTVIDPDTGKKTSKLTFEDKKKPPSKLSQGVKEAPVHLVAGKFHKEIRETEQDNVGVESAHKSEEAVETSAYLVREGYRSHKLKPYRKAAQAEQKLEKANVNALYQKSLRENPQFTSNPLSRWQQKQSIKKQYAVAKRTGQTAGNTAQAASKTGKAARTVKEKAQQAGAFVMRHKKGFLMAGVFFLIACMLMNTMSSCSMMAQSIGSVISGTTYPSDDPEMLAVAVALVQYAKVPVLSQLARFYIWVIRGTPLLVQLFIIFYGLPSVGIMLDAFPAAVIAFAFNEGAYCAETMRGALESVPQGQLEAGYCVGMSWWQIMRRIVLPQALRTAVPALSNSLIGMIKDTSLASNITVAELFMAGQRVAARTYIFLPIYCEVAVVYLLFCTVITKLQALLERRLNAHGFQ